jgi:hypothetical protein
MRCPVLEMEIMGKKCPVTRCMYRSRGEDKSCRFSSVAFEDALSTEQMASLFNQDEADIQRLVETGKVRIEVACVIDAYLSTLDDVRVGTVNSREADDVKTPSVLRIFGIRSTDLPKILDQERYTQWKSRSGVDVSLQDIEALLTLR